MDIRALTASVAQCLQPGSPQRRDLSRRLEQLLEATRAMKAANVEPTSLLTHITLVQAQVFTPGAQSPLSDRERELALQSLLEALRPARRTQLTEVHAIIVDHLTRVLIPLFATGVGGGSGGGLPEPTRQLAIACWRQLVTVIASVHVPRTHPPNDAFVSRPCTVDLSRYMAAYLPADYLSLVACALLDNAELADSYELRTAALEALRDILRPEVGVLGDCNKLRPMFPGVASALTRVALAQPPSKSDVKQQGDGQKSNEMESGMANMTIDASAWRKPTAAVRALAIDALHAAVLVLYGKAATGGSETSEKEGQAEGWARRARHGIESILDETNEEDESSSSDEYLRRLRHMLWRLAGLRHTEYKVISRALLRLFSSVALDCAALRATPCASVATEACFALDRSVPEYADHVDRLTALCRGDPEYARTVAQLLDSALPMFDRYIGRGSETQRLDVLALVAGYACVLPRPEAHAQLSPWWTARGLRVLLKSLG
ncbi:hypothetical protein IWW38_001908, partial [Coemansia aciculifera]